MLSPYKLYQYDKPLARIPNPAGKAICSRHYNVDWTVHRLLPAAVSRRGRLTQKSIGRIIAPISQRTKNGRRTAAPERFREAPAQVFADSSPRWGERGEAPAGGKTVALPKKGAVELSKGTIAGGGIAAASAGGYTNHKLDGPFQMAILNSQPKHKYKQKIKKGSYTQYKY